MNPDQMLRPVRRIILPALAFGLATGLLEVAVISLRNVLLERRIAVSPQFVWAAPVVDVIAFLLIGIGIAALQFVLRRPVPRAVTIAVLATATIAVLSLSFPQIDRVARLILAVGFGVQAGRWLGRGERMDRAVRRAVPLCAAVVVALAVGVHGIRFVAERFAVAELPRAESGTPNILLLILDTVRAESLGLYGNAHVRTPVLDSIARTGTVYEMPIAPSSWTLPTHASIFTGRWPHELSATWLDPLDDAYPVLAELLGQNGYRTGGFVANLQMTTRESGLARGFSRYRDYPRSLGQWLMDSSIGRRLSRSSALRQRLDLWDNFNRKTASSVNNELLEWIVGGPGRDRPYFAFVNYYDAHEPYLPPPEFQSPSHTTRRLDRIQHFGNDQGRKAFEKQRMTEEEVRAERDAYEGSIGYIDHEIGILLQSMRARGLLDNTLIVITSDHGEQFGRRGLFEHGNSLYSEAIRVPLILIFPGRVPSGRRIPEPVTLRGLAATIAKLVGIRDHPFPGAPLDRYFTDSSADVATDEPLFSEVDARRSGGWLHSVVADGYHLIRSAENGSTELFDLTRDPYEATDISKDTAAAATLARLSALLDAVHMQGRSGAHAAAH